MKADTMRFASWEEAVAWLIAQPDMQDLVRACYYDQPVLQAAERYWRSEEWSALRGYLPRPPGMALDTGAGMGIASYALARDGWNTTALEPDSCDLVGAGAIKKLSADARLDISVVRQWGEQLPFASGEFDLVHARQVLHHARDLKRFCLELFRVLKPDGTLTATREHVISGPDQLRRFLDRHPLHRIYGGENAFTLAEYRGALKDAGFRIEAELGPFDSVINYAPYSRDALREAIIGRLAGVPLGGALGRLALAKPWDQAALRLLSRFDKRPGRLFTFIATKPGGAI